MFPSWLGRKLVANFWLFVNCIGRGVGRLYVHFRLSFYLGIAACTLSYRCVDFLDWFDFPFSIAFLVLIMDSLCCLICDGLGLRLVNHLGHRCGSNYLRFLAVDCLLAVYHIHHRLILRYSLNYRFGILLHNCTSTHVFATLLVCLDRQAEFSLVLDPFSFLALIKSRFVWFNGDRFTICSPLLSWAMRIRSGLREAYAIELYRVAYCLIWRHHNFDGLDLVAMLEWLLRCLEVLMWK